MSAITLVGCDAVHESIETKPLKILQDNEDEIVEALKSINGKGYAHTLRTYGGVCSIVRSAERELKILNLPKRLWCGARYVRQSGERLPKAYQHKAQTTTVIIERRSNDWTIIRIARTSLWPKKDPEYGLYLTAEQKKSAVSILEQNLKVAPLSQRELGKKYRDRFACLDSYNVGGQAPSEMVEWLEENAIGWLSVPTMGSDAIIFPETHQRLAFDLRWRGVDHPQA